VNDARAVQDVLGLNLELGLVALSFRHRPGANPANQLPELSVRMYRHCPSQQDLQTGMKFHLRQ
jgi:hypothetical protein